MKGKGIKFLMQHKLINTYSINQLILEIDKHLKNSFSPTLAFIYTSVSYDLEQLNLRLQKYTFLIIGATTVGEIYADNLNGVNTKDKSITCMLLNINALALALTVKNIEDNNFYNLGKEIAKWSKEQFEDPAIITITAGLYFDNDSYIKGIQTNINYLFGAAAGDDREFQNTFVFSGKKLISSGVIALAIDRDKIDIVGSRGFGWSGIGTQRIVTKAKKNIVYTIDDKPAINFYKNYLHITQEDMPDMGADFPLEVQLNNGQILYRAAIHINEKDGSLLFAGHVPENSKVRISAPIGEMVIEHIQKSIQTSLRSHHQFKADFTLIFPCAAHKKLLGTYSIKEIEAVYNAVQQSPLIGFYAYGEIASSLDSNAFHNETFVTVQLSEKK